MWNQHYADQVRTIQEEAYVTIAETRATLVEIINATANYREAYPHLPQPLVLVIYDLTLQHYGKYLLVSNRLLTSSSAQQKALQLNDDLIKSPIAPSLWEVRTFLVQRPKLALKECFLPKYAPLFLPCGYMYVHPLVYNLPEQKSACQEQYWPKLTTTAGMINVLCRVCLRDQQRQLTMATYPKVYNFTHLCDLITHSIKATGISLERTYLFGDQDNTPCELALYDIYACRGRSVTLNVTHMTKLMTSIAATPTVAAKHVRRNTTEETIRNVGACALTTCNLLFVFVMLNYTPFTVRQKLLQAATLLIGAMLHLLDLNLRIMS